MSDVRLILGDCLDVLPTLDVGSIDACVTDPPYDLLSTSCGGFMGKRWDATGVAFRPETWEAVRRVLKPGGYLLAFGSTRTYHRLVCAIEDAGFTIRDTVIWLYGSGFPKAKSCLKPAWEPVTWALNPLNHKTGDDTIIVETTNLIEALLWFLAPAKLAEKVFSACRDGSSVRWLATTLGVASVLERSDLTDTFRSPERASTFLSIAWLWNVILGERSRQPSTFTTETGTGLTIALKTLNCLISQITPEPIILVANRDAGLWLNAPSANGNSSGNGPGWNTIPKPSADGPVTWQVVDAVVNGLVSIVELLSSRFRPSNASSVKTPVTTLTGRLDVDMVLSRTIQSEPSPAWEPITLAWNPAPKVTPLNIDSCRTGISLPRMAYREPGESSLNVYGNGLNGGKADGTTTLGRWPANVCHDGSPEVLEAFAAFGETRPGHRPRSQKSSPGSGRTIGDGWRPRLETDLPSNNGFGDSGSAARFFYCAKAGRRERNAGLEGMESRESTHSAYDPSINAVKRCSVCNRTHAMTHAGPCVRCGSEHVAVGPASMDGSGRDACVTRVNNHPTVKPVALMRWLVRLITPENGTVLDPFAGSGSTGVACHAEGFSFVGIESDPAYVEIARRRLDAAQSETPLFADT